MLKKLSCWLSCHFFQVKISSTIFTVELYVKAQFQTLEVSCTNFRVAFQLVTQRNWALFPAPVWWNFPTFAPILLFTNYFSIVLCIFRSLKLLRERKLYAFFICLSDILLSLLFIHAQSKHTTVNYFHI